MEKTIKQLKRDKITIRYQGEKVTIDIANELSINENIINSQLKESPSSYAFLSLIKNKLIRERDRLETEKDVAFSEAYIFYKNSKVSGMTNELANHKAKTTPKVISLTNKWLIATNKADDLIAICKAYEGRERVLQTLSANLRREH